jgi:hypothetical protein
MAFEVSLLLDNKADHRVNCDLAFSVLVDTDEAQVLYQSHLVSDLRFQIK